MIDPASEQRLANESHIHMQGRLDVLTAENERLRSRLAAAEAVIKIAEDAMCQATFNLRGRNCGDLNHAIDRTRKYLKQAADHAAKGGECDGRRQN